MLRTIEWLRRNDVAVVGMQEFEAPQRRVFQAQATEFDLFPAGASRYKRHANSIAWRSSAFELVSGRFLTIPYFYGKPWPMPVVTLRNRMTGQEFDVMNVHNPASTRGTAARWRAQAVRTERRAVQRIVARTGRPVFLTGDFNDPLADIDLGMRPAAGAVIDHIFTTPEVQVHGRRVDQSVKGGFTDHPAVIARVGGLGAVQAPGPGVAGSMCGTGAAMDCPATPWPPIEAGLTPD
ncbi:MAG: endonuclease/exonuclease/phosphatase family protein, partial [Stackebrandtia sp.]